MGKMCISGMFFRGQSVVVEGARHFRYPVCWIVHKTMVDEIQTPKSSPLYSRSEWQHSFFSVLKMLAKRSFVWVFG